MDLSSHASMTNKKGTPKKRGIEYDIGGMD
jgi:hypothetical protein